MPQFVGIHFDSLSKVLVDACVDFAVLGILSIIFPSKSSARIYLCHDLHDSIIELR